MATAGVAWRACVVALLLTFILIPTPLAAQSSGQLYLLILDDTLAAPDVALARRAIAQAEARAGALLIELRASGGVVRDLRELTDAIAAASAPVLVYVTPADNASGAAGALLLPPAHIAALAPGASFGTAAPLVPADASATSELLRDDFADRLRAVAADRGRDLSWIDQAVVAGIVIDSAQATTRAPPAVDLVAATTADLLTRLDGRVVRLAGGEERTLRTLNRAPVMIEPSVFERLLLVLTEPTVVFGLLVLGALSAALEVATPSFGVFLGVGLLLLAGALYGIFTLPVQGWALLVLVLGLGCFGAELLTPTHGGLTITGLGLLTIGGLNLFDQSRAPGVAVAPAAVIATGIGIGALVVAAIALGLRDRRRPRVTGGESLIGRIAEVRAPLAPRGLVFVEGALWLAVSERGEPAAGEWVRIIARERLQLIVRPIDDEG